MNNLVLYIIVLSGFILKVNAQQNLVPNPSFENYTECPYSDNQVHFAEPWLDPGGSSPDYFHVCSNGFGSTIVGVPQNWQGYQQPRTGEGYMGLVCYEPNYEGKEYIHVELNSTLTEGQLYLVRFYAVLSNGSGNAINSLGANFSDEQITSFDISFPNFTPQIVSNMFITDKEKWMEISGCYLAKGTEKFLTIGNFRSNADTELYETGDSQSGSLKHSYYYIEDVSVVPIEDSASCIRTPVLEIPNVFTPNGDVMNDYYHLNYQHLENLEFVILNRWGNVVFKGKDDDSWNGTNIKGNQLSEGVYFVKASYIDPRDQQTKIKTGYVHLIR